MSSAQPGPPSQPGRYQRSSSGLLAAMVILLLFIAAFVGFRALFRGNQDEPVPAVDYSLSVRQARGDGVLAPAPSPMPAGWHATSVRYQAGRRPTWHLGILTDQDTYVGVEESRSKPATMVDDFLGRGATQGKARQIAGRTWQTWRDGSAYGLTASIGDDTVFVGGRAGEAKVVRLVGVLGFGG